MAYHGQSRKPMNVGDCGTLPVAAPGTGLRTGWGDTRDNVAAWSNSF